MALPRTSLFTASAASAALALAGCAGPRYFVRDLPPSAGAFLVNAPATYAPESVAPVSRGETDALRKRFSGSLDPAMRPLLRPEPALDLVAAVLAETFSETQERAASSTLQWMLWKAGSTASTCRVDLGWSKGAEERRAASLEDAAYQWARIGGLTTPSSYGLARFSQGRVTSQALVVCEASLAVDPFPKSYAPGAPISLRFKSLDESSHFVFLADTVGAPVEKELRPGADGFFVVEHTAPTKPGRYFLEVRALYPRTAHGKAAPRSVLWVPIYVDVPEPARPDAFMRAAVSGADKGAAVSLDSRAWSQRVVALFDAERAKVGQGPIAFDAHLGGLAAARANSLAKHGGDAGYARKLPSFVRTGDAVWDFTEVFGREESPEEQVQLAMLHPSAKKLIRTPKLLLGVGAAPSKRVDDEPETQSVVEMLWAQGASMKPSPDVVAAAPREVTRSPAAEQFLVVPLHVMVLRSRFPALSAAPNLVERVRPIVDEVNRVWSAAGVYFRVDDARVIDADTETDHVDDALAKLPPAERAAPPNRVLAAAIPAGSRVGQGFRLYFIHDFDIAGIFLGRGDLMVKDAIRPIPGGKGDDGIARVLSHELGHGLGLAHRQDRVGLMSWGNTGFRLTEAEAARARGVAQAQRGTENLEAAKRRDPKIAAAIAALADRDVSRWQVE